MSNSNNNNEEKMPEKKILNKKRLPTYNLEDIINIYCCQHKIQDNEIMDKIKTIHYENPAEKIEINYDKDKGDKFPLSSHIKPIHLQKELELDEEKEEKVEDKKEESDKEEIVSCFICEWKFLKGMSLEEKNTHINLCAEGKGEQNKKELISTYSEIEKLQNQNERNDDANNGGDNANNENKEEDDNNDKNEKREKNSENKNEEDEDDDDEEEEEEIASKNDNKKIDDDNNDD